MKTLTVNLYGGPGSGKSTVMAGLFYRLKMAGFSVEQAPEWCKRAVYEGRPYAFQDQIYSFAQQRKLLNELQGKVEIAVCDSPLLLHAVYGKKTVAEPMLKPFQELVRASWRSCRNCDVFLRRPANFERNGRIHSEAESLALDKAVEAELAAGGGVWWEVQSDADACESIFQIVCRELGCPAPAEEETESQEESLCRPGALAL